MLENLKSLSAHNGFMRYFKNTSWLFGEKILRMIVALFVGVWVARYLGPEKFGLLSYAQSFVAIFSAFATLGLEGIVARELVKSKSEVEKTLETSFWLKFFGAILLYIIIFIAFEFIPVENNTQKLIFIVAGTSFFHSFSVIELYFQSQVLGKLSVFSNLTSIFVGGIIKVLLIINNASLKLFAWVIFFESIILSIGYLYQYKKIRNIRFQFPKFNNFIAVKLLKDSLPLMIGSFSATIYMKIDQLMIKQYLSDEAVGIYAVSSRISEIPIFITAVITSSLFPAIIKANEFNYQLFIRRLQELNNLLVKIAFLISLVISLFSSIIIETLYGSSYVKSASILSIYVWSLIFIYLSNVSTVYFLTKNLVIHASMRLIIGAILNITLNVFLIEKYGLKGAAISTLISYSISSYFYNILFRKTLDNFKIQTKSLISIFNIKSYFKFFNYD